MSKTWLDIIQEYKSQYEWGGSENEEGELSNGIIDFEEMVEELREVLDKPDKMGGDSNG